jgi:ribonuclease Z
MDLDVVFLGTAGSAPTARRAPSATLLRRGGWRVLVDCGEGTQRQLMRSVVGLPDLDLVALTHFHADHVLGLPGMLKTFALRERESDLVICGPPGLLDLFRVLDPLVGRLPFPLDLRECRPGDAIPDDGCRIEAHAASHRAPAIAWALIEDDRPGRFDVDAARSLGVVEGPQFGVLQRGGDVTLEDGTVVRSHDLVGEARRGRRVVLSGDTRPCATVLEAARGADLLVHEASFTAEDAARAAETGHSTANDAALLARQAGVRLLALTHLGGRALPRAVEE